MKYLREAAIPTVIEVVTLIAWFILAVSAKTQGQKATAIGVLFAGLLIEHLVNQKIYAGLPSLNEKRWVIVSAIETVIWATWLALTQGTHILLGAVVLYAGLLIEHTLSENVLENRTSLFGRLFAKAVIFFTVLEVINAYVLLSFIPSVVVPVVMVVLSELEHSIALRVADEKG